MKYGKSIAAALTATLALSGAYAGVGMAIHDQPDKERIKRVARSDAGATHLARAIFEGSGRHLVRSKFVTVPPGNDPVAISNRPLAGFPARGRSFAILSTGCARLAYSDNNSGILGCANGGVRVRGARDVTIWRIRVKVPRGANCLSFRFKFLSEEFPEFVGSKYNDAFIAELGRSSTWNTVSDRDPVIRAPQNFATTRDGNLVSINGTQNARVSRAAARGTTYNAATGKLRASTPVKPGSRLLYLSIFDQGDREFDSAVFVDRLTIRKAQKCRSGLVRSK